MTRRWVDGIVGGGAAYPLVVLFGLNMVDELDRTAFGVLLPEIRRDFGFRRIRETNPYKAPVGSVLVYGGRGAGHVEFRTKRGFVSDFVSLKPSPRPLIGIFVKPRA